MKVGLYPAQLSVCSPQHKPLHCESCPNKPEILFTLTPSSGTSLAFLCPKIVSRSRCCQGPGFTVRTPLNIHREWGGGHFSWVHFKTPSAAKYESYQNPKAKCLFQLFKNTNSLYCTDKHTHYSHLTSTSLFPKGSKRNQASNRGVLCKQAKGISTCGSKQQTRTQNQTGKNNILQVKPIFCNQSIKFGNFIFEASSLFPESHSCPPCPSPRPPRWRSPPHSAPLDPAPAPVSLPSEGNESS